MRIHAIQTGLVQIETRQIDGRGHGLVGRIRGYLPHGQNNPTPSAHQFLC